jgi:hypothetical protein
VHVALLQQLQHEAIRIVSSMTPPSSLLSSLTLTSLLPRSHISPPSLPLSRGRHASAYLKTHETHALKGAVGRALEAGYHYCRFFTISLAARHAATAVAAVASQETSLCIHLSQLLALDWRGESTENIPIFFL